MRLLAVICSGEHEVFTLTAARAALVSVGWGFASAKIIRMHVALIMVQFGNTEALFWSARDP